MTEYTIFLNYVNWKGVVALCDWPALNVTLSTTVHMYAYKQLCSYLIIHSSQLIILLIIY
jgi:hypothetical protein